MNTPIQSSAPHAYPFKPENTKRGYGAIDIVVNIYTPEAIAENRIPTDANFIDKDGKDTGTTACVWLCLGNLPHSLYRLGSASRDSIGSSTRCSCAMDSIPARFTG